MLFKIKETLLNKSVYLIKFLPLDFLVFHIECYEIMKKPFTVIKYLH